MITRLLNPFYEAPTLPLPTSSSATALTPIDFEAAHQELPIAQQELPIARKVERKAVVKRVQGGQPYPSPKLRPVRSCSPDSVVSNSDDADADALIHKPEGEAGRPGRGGYNLETAVGWNTIAYHQLKDFVHKLATEHLDETLSYIKQHTTSVQLVRTLALEKFPALKEFNNLWPVTDLLKLRLKATSQIARQKERMAGLVDI